MSDEVSNVNFHLFGTIKQHITPLPVCIVSYSNAKEVSVDSSVMQVGMTHYLIKGMPYWNCFSSFCTCNICVFSKVKQKNNLTRMTQYEVVHIQAEKL